MIFIWDRWNRAHLKKHHVSEAEAQYIVEYQKPPFPRYVGDGKYQVKGQTAAGRYLQVIFCFREEEEIGYEELDLETIIDLSDDDSPNCYVIHARDLTDREKRRLRQHRS